MISLLTRHGVLLATKYKNKYWPNSILLIFFESFPSSFFSSFLNFLFPTALSRYMDLTLAELSNMETTNARFSTLTINNIAYQNHIITIMYCKRTFGGKRHFKLCSSKLPLLPTILIKQLLSRGKI